MRHYINQQLRKGKTTNLEELWTKEKRSGLPSQRSFTASILKESEKIAGCK